MLLSSFALRMHEKLTNVLTYCFLQFVGASFLRGRDCDFSSAEECSA